MKCWYDHNNTLVKCYCNGVEVLVIRTCGRNVGRDNLLILQVVFVNNFCLYVMSFFYILLIYF